MDARGNLYGTTELGGARDDGAVYELVPKAVSGSRYKVIYSFCNRQGCPVGSEPATPLIVDTAGDLYGVVCCSNKDNGSVYELVPGAVGGKWKVHVLLRLCSGTLCISDPLGGLAYAGQASGQPYDGSSPLYGTAAGGGAHTQGVVYELEPDGAKWKAQILYNFCSQGGFGCTDGAEPGAGLLVSGSRTLYGTTEVGGGKKNDGVVFELTGGGVETVLHTFCTLPKCADGANPLSTPVMDGAGNLFGTTRSGGKPGYGVVFEVSPEGTETVLHDFCSRKGCVDGGNPRAGLVIDPSGNLFGMASYAGAYNGGVLFEVAGAHYSVPYPFCSIAGCGDGSWPLGSLIMDGSGNLYGVTEQGGANAEGTVFRLAP